MIKYFFKQNLYYITYQICIAKSKANSITSNNYFNFILSKIEYFRTMNEIITSGKVQNWLI